MLWTQTSTGKSVKSDLDPYQHLHTFVPNLCLLIMEVSSINNVYYLQEKSRRKERQGDRDRERNMGKSKEEEGKWLFDRYFCLSFLAFHAVLRIHYR